MRAWFTTLPTETGRYIGESDLLIVKLLNFLFHCYRAKSCIIRDLSIYGSFLMHHHKSLVDLSLRWLHKLRFLMIKLGRAARSISYITSDVLSRHRVALERSVRAHSYRIS